MPGEAVASTPGAKLGGLVVGDGSVVVPWQARVLGTWSLARSGGTCVKACGLLVESEKPTEAGLVVWASKPSERVKAAWAKSRRHGVQSARALAGGQDTSQHRGFGGFPQNRHPSSGFPGIPPKTMGDLVAQGVGVRGVIAKLASRRSKVVKASCSSDEGWKSWMDLPPEGIRIVFFM